MEQADQKFPRQTRFIIGNEACERFSFYGMKGILVTYMTTQLLIVKDDATEILHYFLAAIYILPLLGGWLADRFLGRYHTILYLSLFYCLGHGILAFSDMTQDVEMRKIILFTGLGFIAFGAGGIKPCVSSFMGDQFKPEQHALISKAYAAFYWSINLGSFAAFLIIPAVQENFGWGWAFGIPGLAMGLATLVFWLGRKSYIHVPPQGKQKRDSLLGVYFCCFEEWIKRLLDRGQKRGKIKGGTFWQPGYNRYSIKSVENTKAIVRILKIFVLTIPFWALFEQTGSSWVLQGREMEEIRFFGSETVTLFGYDISQWGISAVQLQAANPVFVMLLIPFLTMVVYPRVKWLNSPLRRMGLGMAILSVSFFIIGGYQWYLGTGGMMNIAWQILPYFILTLAEVMFSITGLEFAYTQAPKELKSVVTSFWNLTIAGGNLLVAAITRLMGNGTGDAVLSTSRFFLYGGLVVVVSVLFAYVAFKYKKSTPGLEE